MNVVPKIGNVTLRVNRVEEMVEELGPGPAAVIVCQGCTIGCAGCMSTYTWDAAGGFAARTRDIVRWLTSTRCRFLTVTGGEPTEQAEALNDLLAQLGTDWIVTVFSGRTFEDLAADPSPAIQALLGRADLLIAGPYVREQHADLLWRGSSNQTVTDLTGRAPIPADRSVGVSVRIRNGMVDAIGVPPTPGFEAQLRAVAEEYGLDLTPSFTRPLPFPATEA